MTNKILSFLIIASFLIGCNDSEPDYMRLGGYTMGTTYHVTLETNPQYAEGLQKAIDERLVQINQLMSTYLDDSELSVFNQTQSTACLPLSYDTLFVVGSALEVSVVTNGKFDVTLAPLIEMWGFDKKETDNQIPTQAEIDKNLKNIGYRKIDIGDLNDHCITKAIPQISINLSAIAKGYAVDQIALILQQNQIKNYMVEIGGEVANKGVNSKGEDWKIAIESPLPNQTIQRVITPKGMGIATSGDYRNYFEKNGKRYSHTLDPTTGYPIDHNLASITVLHPETMFADAYATAMMVMGPEESLKLADELQLPIFMLLKTEKGFEEVYNDRFKSYLMKSN
ncbi:MAG: FAD:protein FMN transferase [Gammaproteobacteria bacterium]|nr:FAD:protein FMN transferase [Gammaproteobacteria bacterium]